MPRGGRDHPSVVLVGSRWSFVEVMVTQGLVCRDPSCREEVTMGRRAACCQPRLVLLHPWLSHDYLPEL